MATTKQAKTARGSGWLRTLVLVLILVAALGWFFRAPITGYGENGTAHAARNVCACLHLSGQPESVCKRNYVLGTPPVLLGEDAEERSVTAHIPLVASNTATYREGFGCVLEPWGG